MIDTKEKLKHCLAVEKSIYFPGGGVRLPFGIREKDVLYGYIYNLRKTEYHLNNGHKLRLVFYKMRLQRMANLYGIHIGVNVWRRRIEYCTCRPHCSSWKKQNWEKP